MNIIKQALQVMESEFTQADWTLNKSELAKDFCRLQIGAEKDEVFSVLFLDNHNCKLDFKTFFHGTINECNIYLRPIVRHGLEINAAKVILVHNHPSGNCTPSDADVALTREFKTVLDKLQLKLIDHIIVSPTGTASLCELGMI